MADQPQSLPALVRAKYPGVYDDLSDAELDAKVRAKYPGVYDDVAGPQPTFKTTNNPPSLALKAEAAAKNLGNAALDALPGAGAILGGVVGAGATPEAGGLGGVPGAALGAGAGRGLRDLIAEGFGLEPKTSPASKAGRIAMDTAETAAVQSIVPGLWEAIKTPGRTVGELIDTLPRRVLGTDLRAFIKNALPKGIEKAPAAILERPAWQTWGDHLPADAQPSPQVARTTGTSMIPAAVPSPVASTPSAAPVIQPQGAMVPPAAAATELPNQKVLNDLAIAAHRAKIALTAEEYPVLAQAVEKGATLAQAISVAVRQRLAAELAAKLGSLTDAEMAARLAQRARTGQWKAPSADMTARANPVADPSIPVVGPKR